MSIDRRTLTIVSIVGLGIFSASGSTIQSTGIGGPSVAQTGVYYVHRDIFNNGGHNWLSLSPGTYQTYAPDASYAQGSATVGFNLAAMVPNGATITAATLDWSFANLSAPAPAAYVSQVLEDDTGTPCLVNGFLCEAAVLKYFSPNFNFFADQINLEGDSSYALASPIGVASGSFNLLQAFSPQDLISHKLDFVGSVILNLGRPFFDDEGYNADTYFNVSGNAQADETATVTVQFTPAPEQASIVLAFAGLAFLALLRRRRPGSRSRSRWPGTRARARRDFMTEGERRFPWMRSKGFCAECEPNAN